MITGNMPMLHHATDRVDGNYNYNYNYNYNAYNSGIMHNDNVRIFRI